jgi:hypothetical protein
MATGLKLRTGTPWMNWLNNLADWCRVPVATVIDQALARYAENVGFHWTIPPRVQYRRGLNTTDRIRIETDQYHGTGAFQLAERPETSDAILGRG